MSPELIRSLDLIKALMPPDQPWWIIGSTALHLSGLDISPKDIDVVASAEVIEAARIALNAPSPPPRHDPKFRSNPYFQHTPDGGLEIDFMGDLEVLSAGLWHGLQIESQLMVAGVRIPSLGEQRRILSLFGRDKDLARIKAMDGL